MNTFEIENMLRDTALLTPPPGLKARLMDEIPAPPSQPVASSSVGFAGWFRRWWPALAPATISLVCVAVMAAQQMEIRKLQAALRTVSQAVARTAASSVQAKRSALNPEAPGPAAVDQEIARLKELVAQLIDQVARGEQARQENEKLRGQLAAPLEGIIAPEETNVLANAQEKALRLKCAQFLEKLAIAGRVWAVDNDGVLPPNILSMTNEISGPQTLICPADKSRQPASGWAAFTPANSSYEYLASDGPTNVEPNRVIFRCLIHGLVALGNGSVPATERPQPESIQRRDGKLFYQPLVAPANPNAGRTTPDADNPAPSPAPEPGNP